MEGPHHNFVANGIVTHNSVNEYSGRYSLMPLLFYNPRREHFALQSGSSNQGRAVGDAGAELYAEAVRRWEGVRSQVAADYGWLASENVARELARIDLPLSTYTQWYWKIDLHNCFTPDAARRRTRAVGDPGVMGESLPGWSSASPR